MNTRQKGLPPPPPPAPINLRDIYYVLFRHKWMILLLTALGVAGSVAIGSLWPFPFNSQAELFIRYIQDISDPTSMDGTATRLKSPDDRGANILNTELKVLTSTDLYAQVASNIGPARILGLPSESNNVNAAVIFIGNHFKAEVANNSDVILLTYSAGDPAVVRPVLAALIDAYKKRYLEIHMTPGFTDQSLQEQIDIAKGRLAETMQTLESLKADLGIIALSDATKNMADQLAKTEENIFLTKAEMAETEATVKDLQERIPKNGIMASDAAEPPALALSAELAAKYQSLNSILSSRRLREQELGSQFTPDNKLVQNAQQQRAAAEADIKQFEEQNPLASKQKESGWSGTISSGPVVADPLAAYDDAVTKEHGLRARFIELSSQLDSLKTNVAGLNIGEGKILQAQTEMDVAQRKYEHLRLAAEQSRINDAVGNKVSNISTVEQPTPAAHDAKQIFKVIGGVMGCFLVLAFGLPFLIELVLNQSFTHPADVQARIAAPFFITFPRTNGHGKLPAIKRAKVEPLLPAHGSAANGAESTDPIGKMAPSDQRHKLRPYFETLRDRIMTYFEMINLTHKPKLVAVTSCDAGAGVTTTAAGLASSLSEMGEGNVLLVNMNVGDGEAHHFYKGKLTCGIEDALATQKPDQAQVDDNLFVAKEMESDDKLPRLLPKRFSHLVPMMRAGDYDYIIFDMPPVSEISITPRLARFMDMVLLVIESGKTSREAAIRTATLLGETKTNVGLVLNKNRSYVPRLLDRSI